jgi:hypothetical protein
MPTESEKSQIEVNESQAQVNQAKVRAIDAVTALIGDLQGLVKEGIESIRADRNR